MNTFAKTAFIGAIVAGIAATACAAEPAAPEEDASALDVALDGIDPQDEGTSYNGWTQSVWGRVCGAEGWWTWSHTLTRSSGDATRGGGACFVVNMGTSCSADASCLSQAQAGWGSSAWGYCYAGSCYGRPGSQTDFCTMNPNRSPGTMNGFAFTNGGMSVLGCMTKTAGPNTACGGTNGSLYMRTVSPAEYWYSCIL